MAVLLGMVDAPVCQDNLSWDTNKIGGKPDWASGDGSTPDCSGCRRKMYLACQLYCPLDGSQYHRTLYTFACTHRPCWNTSHGWRVLRCQRLDKAPDQPTCSEDSSAKCSSSDWGIGAEDWGDDDDDEEDAMTGSSAGALSACPGAEAFPSASRSPMDLVADIRSSRPADLSASALGGGDAAGDMHNLLSSPLAQLRISERGDSNLSAGRSPTSPTGSQHSQDAGRSTSSVQSPRESPQEEPMTSATGYVSSLPDLIRMTLQPDSEMTGDDRGDSPEEANVEAEPLPLSEERAREMKQMLSLGSSGQAGMESDVDAEAAAVALTSFHLNVYEEASSWADAQDATLDHAREALRKYEREHGLVETASGDVTSKRGGGGGGGEAYEKVGPRHGDLNHHKFLSCVQKYPGLCVRYQWQGRPLWISPPASLSLPTRCRHCGGPSVFEFQLMPALINVLRVPGQSEVAVEFGSVLVFSCAGSCWEEGFEGVKEENVFVQPDPDQHFFKV